MKIIFALATTLTIMLLSIVSIPLENKYLFFDNKAITACAEQINDTEENKTEYLSDVTITNNQVFTYSVKLFWNQVDGATGYNIYFKSEEQWTKIATTQNTSYTILKLNCSTTYTFAVKAYNDISESQNFDELTVTTKLPDVKMTNSQISTYAVKLSWKKLNDAVGYSIYKKNNNTWKKIGTTKSTNYTIKKLNSSTKYTFQLNIPLLLRLITI